MYNRVTLRSLLGLDVSGRRTAVRAGQLAGPARVRFLLGLAHQCVEVLEGLPEALPRVGEPSRLR
jgi:hypothetical protein